MKKTKEELQKMSDDELLEWHNSLVEENLEMEDPDDMMENYSQMELFQRVWLERHGVEDKMIEVRVPRNLI
jgi:hypothetical protein